MKEPPRVDWVPGQLPLPAATERTPLERLHDQLRLWVDGDLDQFTFACAVAVSAADTEGEPLWGQIVGAPSAAKTEAVRVVGDTASAALDEVTVPGLLGWQRIGKTARMTGALARLGNDPPAALLTIGDFSTLLSGADKRSGSDADDVFRALRRIYDGSFARSVGTAPEELTWHGRISILSAVTHAIDDYTAHADALGPRWVYFRVPEVESKRRTASRDRRTMPLPKRRANAADLARRAILRARAQVGQVELSDALLDVLDEAAEVVARARGAVPRDGYGRRDIIGEPSWEEPYRLRQQLQALARACLALEMAEQDVVRLVTRCALDTVPRTRTKVLRALATGRRFSVKGLAEAAGGIDRKVCRRAAEDLRALGLAACPSLDESEWDADENGMSAPRDWQLGNGGLGQLVMDVFAAQHGREGCAQKE